MSPRTATAGARSRRAWPAWRESAALLACATALAAAVWLVRQPRLPLRADEAVYAQELGYPLIDPAAAVALYRDNLALIVDTRAAGGDVAAGGAAAAGGARVPGALVIREATFDDDLLALHDFLTPEDKLVLHGDGNLQVLAAVAARLARRGYTNLVLMRGDLAAWRAAGGPLREADGDA
jgi:rhodanese-related sulfurtransferase